MEEYGPDGLRWACSNCPKKRSADLHAYTKKLLHIKAMQDGGYPYGKNDLTVDEWLDIGQVRRALEPSFNCPLMTSKQP